MVNVVITESGDRRSIAMTGHAGYNAGNDIVCAACSALAYALMGWVDNSSVEADTMDDYDGDFELVASGGSEFHAAFDVAKIGLMMIAKEYPENVRIFV